MSGIPRPMARSTRTARRLSALDMETVWHDAILREVVTYLLSEKKRRARVSCGKSPAEPLYGGTEDGEERGEADERSLRSCARLGVRQLCTGPT
jgi:hypothetical protein